MLRTPILSQLSPACFVVRSLGLSIVLDALRMILRDTAPKNASSKLGLCTRLSALQGIFMSMWMKNKVGVHLHQGIPPSRRAFTPRKMSCISNQERIKTPPKIYCSTRKCHAKANSEIIWARRTIRRKIISTHRNMRGHLRTSSRNSASTTGSTAPRTTSHSAPSTAAMSSGLWTPIRTALSRGAAILIEWWCKIKLF